MTVPSPARRAVSGAAIAAIAVLVIAAAAHAANRLVPRVVTGSISHVRGTSAVLEGSVNPHGLETSYFFQYGPTAAYGLQTPTVAVGKGTTAIKVGQTVLNLPPGAHYRIVATNAAGTSRGRDRTYTPASSRLKFVMASTKEAGPTPYGGTFVLRGTLSGAGAALHPITAQSSPFPFLTAFTDLGPPVTPSPAGAFAISVPHLVQSTQFRVRTSDLRPLFSRTVTVRVAARVTLRVRTSSSTGLARLYGTVTPAKVGARVLFQLAKPTRPHGRSESEIRYVTQARTVLKRGTPSTSRFSEIVKVRKGGRYRAYVVLPLGAVVSAASNSVTLHRAKTRR
jgi:hypothetical protein